MISEGLSIIRLGFSLSRIFLSRNPHEQPIVNMLELLPHFISTSLSPKYKISENGTLKWLAIIIIPSGDGFLL